MAAAALVACCALLGTAAEAGAQPAGVIVSPKPHKRIRHHPIRAVVRAGPEFRDLRARLNGVSLGRHFLVGRPGRRVLELSNSHGLRHGLNVLKVRAGNGRHVRRESVRFRVSHGRPLAGAGRDRPVVAGSPIQLDGQVRERHGRTKDRRVRWEVLDAPSGSRFAEASKSAATARQPAALGSANSPTPTFQPDVIGRYKLAMTAGDRSGATRDRVTLFAVHDSPLVPVHTSTRAAPELGDSRPRIEVGPAIYRAPFICRVSGCSGTYLGTVGSIAYRAYWQVLVLERQTLALVSNRTYGVCSPLGKPDNDPGATFCRMGSNGKPVNVDLAKEITAPGPERLVIASSHTPYVGGDNPDNNDWGRPGVSPFDATVFTKIGFPPPKLSSLDQQVEAAPAGGVSVIGVPGMKPGDAEFTVNPQPGGIDGYLIHDNTTPVPHYRLLRSARESFDTRSPCDSPCTVAQAVGGTNTATQNVAAGSGGYLVSAYERHSLKLQDAQFFTTTTNRQVPEAAENGVVGMTAFLNKWGDINSGRAGSLILVTSQHGSGVASSPLAEYEGIRGPDWISLAEAIASIGGTRHQFNTAAISAGGNYTLIGFGGAAEGNGSEAILGQNPRVRGALVPDQQSLFAPANVDTTGNAPPERLTRLIVREPFETWPLDDDRGASNALQWIGKQLEIGDPRHAYWVGGGISSATAQTLIDRLSCMPPNCANPIVMPAPGDVPAPPNDFNSSDFDTAKGQLLTELGYVKNVRDYISQLAGQLNHKGLDAWEQANSINDDLLSQFNQGKNQANGLFDILGTLKALLDLATLGVSQDVGVIFRAGSTATEFAKVLIDAKYDGSSALSGDPVVAADKLGTQIEADATDTARSLDRMGDIIVSDWTKLEEVGTHGGCFLPGGCAAGYEEYGWNNDMKDAAYDKADLAIKRTLYQHLVPLNFPVWDTGLSHRCSGPCQPPNTKLFSCTTDAGYRPFLGAPARSWFQSLEEYDPLTGGAVWRTWISVARTKQIYFWASKDIFDQMFNPTNPNWLAMAPEDFFREASPVYTPPGDIGTCSWGAQD
jgi:hypothetical protein